MTAGNGTRDYRVNLATDTRPLGEMGRVNMPGALPWAAFGWIDQMEHVPDLIWPTSIKTYNVMRTDPQVSGLYLGVTLPIRRYKWMIADNGADATAVHGIAEDLNLPIQGEPDRKSKRFRDVFQWDDFMRHLMLALCYGFYYFEYNGVVKNNLWRVKSLHPRPPATIIKVDVDDQGGLVSVKQAVGQNAPDIPASRIVPFVWDQEGGNWFGRSLFRSMYKPWLIKDRLLRVDAMHHERNGLGVPWIEAPQGASKGLIENLQALAQSFRAGEESGAAVPYGSKLHLAGVEGTIPPTLESIKYHDEAMARALLMMFVQLGQTKSGARALGESFIDYFSLAQETIALWIEDTINAFLIQNWVDWNLGEDATCPMLVHERNPEPELAIADLVSMIQSGAITVDPELEEYFRARFMLPDKPEPGSPEAGPEPTVVAPEPVPSNLPGEPSVPVPSPPVTAAPGTSARRRATVEATGVTTLLPLPQRTLRRNPYTQEVAAAVDYAQMDTDYASAKAALVADVQSQQKQQIQELSEQIVAAKGDLKKVTSLAATPIHNETILARMSQMMTTGAMQAINEAKRQGKTISLPDLETTVTRLASRSSAVDSLLAQSISEAAGRKALSLTGPVLMSPETVASAVSDYLDGLSGSYLEDQLGGALQQAMNAGRKAVMDEGTPQEIYSSELLDSNTCEYCMGVDGTQYADIDAAEADYPTGGYMDCSGGPRCRGTLIAVYTEADTVS